MIAYKRSIDPGNIRALYDYINLHHDQFCATDDPDKKSEALRLLKGYAAEYLNQVCHMQKFKSSAVERVLTQSAARFEFDPREAGEAFNHLAKYGQNLLEQPWRPEFRILHLSSGYYIHNVQAYLENPHEILIAMGYANIDDDTLQLATLPSPNFLKEVSRDCFIASQECMILSQIGDFIRSQIKNTDVTPAQVYQYRKTHVGDVSTIGQKICFKIHESQHAENLRKDKTKQHQRNGYDCPVDCLIDVGDVGVGLNRSKAGDLPEREIARNVLHYTQREQENIYDPVSSDDFHTPCKNLLSPHSPSINSSSSNFAYNGEANNAQPFLYSTNSYLGNNERYPDDYGLPSPTSVLESRSPRRSSTSSPFIPKTVADFRSASFDNSENYRPEQSSSSSSSSRGQYKALQQEKLSLDQLRRMQRSDSSSGVNESDWVNIERSEANISNSRGEKTLNSISLNNANPNNIKSLRTSDTSAAKYLPTSSAEEDLVLQDALQYHHGVKSLVKSYNPSAIDSTSYDKNIGGENLSKHFAVDSSDRDSSKSSSSETASWGYNKRPSSLLPNHRGSSTVIRSRGSMPNSGISSQPLNSKCDTSKNVSERTHNDFGTEYQREFRSPERNVPPTETNLDSLETVYFNQLVSHKNETVDTALNSSSADPNLSNNARIKEPRKEITGVTDSSASNSLRVHVDEWASDPDSCKQNDGWIDPYAKKRDRIVGRGCLKPKKNVTAANNIGGTQKKKYTDNKMQEEFESRTEDFEHIWTCPHCTYRNHTDINEKICEMCSKSKDFKFEKESSPLVLKLNSGTLKKESSTSSFNNSGSSAESQSLKAKKPIAQKIQPIEGTRSPDTANTIECPHCTYLNPITSISCDICQNRLRKLAEE